MENEQHKAEKEDLNKELGAYRRELQEKVCILDNKMSPICLSFYIIDWRAE